MPTDKNLVIADKKTKRVSCLSQTYVGTVHDKKMADREQLAIPKRPAFIKIPAFIQGYQPQVAYIYHRKSHVAEN